MKIDGKEDPGLSKFLSLQNSAVVNEIAYLKKILYFSIKQNVTFPLVFAFIKERPLQLLQVRKYNL